MKDTGVNILTLKQLWLAGSRFTIHPFRSLHAKALLPLSPKDYICRFSLELVLLMVTLVTVIGNLTLSNRANVLETTDRSTVFAYLKNNPDRHRSLLRQGQTTTIWTATDQWVGVPSFGQVVLASSITSTDPTTIQEDAIVKTNPAESDNFSRSGTSEYEVVSGDNIISIASEFGISAGTVMKANNLDAYSVIHPGQKLTILPTTGVVHKVGTDETLESIAALYKINENHILDINDIELPTDILAGDVLVIPLDQVALPPSSKPASKFVHSEQGRVALSQASAPPNLAGGTLSFLWPTTTAQITQWFQNRHSGLDISNSQRVPIYAAEDGFVELAGWQSGYGNTVILNHGNGFKTLYGHASELYVSAGTNVTKGQTIAKQGNTGRVRGATGIHLHFEIIKNGARINPWSYVRP